MKKIYYTIVVLMILTACNSGTKSEYNVNPDKGKTIKNTVIATHKDTYYDIQITDSFVAFLDYKSDTVVQIYKKDDFSKLHQFVLREGANGKFVSPKFTKSDQLDKHTNSLLLVDNNYLKTLQLNPNQEGESVSIQTAKLSSKLTNSIQYNFITDNILAVSTMDNVNNLFYYFGSGEYYWVKPEPALLPNYKNIPNVFASNLCVNESVNSIACALRFVNIIQFYSLDAEKTVSIQIGKDILPPILGERRSGVDIVNTPKYCIDMVGTSRYVYCLYDGSTDYSVGSTIFIFDWTGKHISTLKTKNNLRKIVVDKEDTHLIALAGNETAGLDVLMVEIH
ncbi:hypothetical protein FACS189411_10600 [Bacteroidia bacterium]|nr:hypothetical protein FACS189411_10600 [Bacteroidia bacterium]